MSQSAYVISKYHKMSSTVGSEELLIDIGANSRVRIFSIFAVNNFNATANSSGVTVGSSGTSLVQPLSQVSFPSHGIVSLSDVFVSGIGTTGVAALTVFYQVG